MLHIGDLFKGIKRKVDEPTPKKVGRPPGSGNKKKLVELGFEDVDDASAFGTVDGQLVQVEIIVVDSSTIEPAFEKSSLVPADLAVVDGKFEPSEVVSLESQLVVLSSQAIVDPSVETGCFDVSWIEQEQQETTCNSG